jgi:hypothetical protein
LVGLEALVLVEISAAAVVVMVSIEGLSLVVLATA